MAITNYIGSILTCHPGGAGAAVPGTTCIKGSPDVSFLQSISFCDFFSPSCPLPRHSLGGAAISVHDCLLNFPYGVCAQFLLWEGISPFRCVHLRALAANLFGCNYCMLSDQDGCRTLCSSPEALSVTKETDWELWPWFSFHSTEQLHSNRSTAIRTICGLYILFCVSEGSMWESRGNYFCVLRLCVSQRDTEETDVCSH